MVKRSVIALVAAGSILLVALACSSNTKANSNQWGVVWNEEFKGTSVPSGWDVLQQNRDNYGGNHLAYNPSNVKVVDNDYLEIKTQRHCVANLDEPLNDSNVSEAPCPSGKMTRYLSGRVTNKTKVVDGTKPFRAEIRAKFNWNGKNGTRPSLWMVNGNSLQNCHHNPNANDPYGELDIIECIRIHRRIRGRVLTQHATTTAFLVTGRMVGEHEGLSIATNTRRVLSQVRSPMSGTRGQLSMMVRQLNTSLMISRSQRTTTTRAQRITKTLSVRHR